MDLVVEFHAGDVLSDLANVTDVPEELLDQWKFGLPMGQYCFSPWELHMIVAIDVCIFVLGIVGNALACTVIACSKSMHTPTNCYLFSLSMSDLLLLVTGAPHEIYEIYYPNSFYAGTVGCWLRSWAAEIAVNMSVMTITAFTYERYLAICRPFVAHVMCQMSRVKKRLVFIWLLVIIMSLPSAWQHRYAEKENGVTVCEFDERIIPHSVEVSSTLFFIIPMSIVTVMYILIARNVVKSTGMKKAGIPEAQIHRRLDKSTKRTVIMLGVITVLSFVLCWAPFHTQRLMAAHFNDVTEDNAFLFDEAFCIITHVAGVFYLLSPAINPFIYSIMSKKFREALEDLVSSPSKKVSHVNHWGYRKKRNDTSECFSCFDKSYFT